MTQEIISFTTVRDMIYQKERINPPLVLDQQDYKGYHYVILSLGTHPCAYVQIPKNHPLYNVQYDLADVVLSPYYIPHGHFTFGDFFNEDNTLSEKVPLGYYLGWDYAHAEDYNPIVPYSQGRQYTTQEIQREVHQVIEGLIVYETAARTHGSSEKASS